MCVYMFDLKIKNSDSLQLNAVIKESLYIGISFRTVRAKVEIIFILWGFEMSYSCTTSQDVL